SFRSSSTSRTVICFSSISPFYFLAQTYPTRMKMPTRRFLMDRGCGEAQPQHTRPQRRWHAVSGIQQQARLLRLGFATAAVRPLGPSFGLGFSAPFTFLIHAAKNARA